MRTAGLFLLLSVLSPTAMAWNEPGIQILDAFYGVRDRFCDASWAVRQQCEGANACKVTANNRLCGDPYRGREKQLTIRYACPERQFSKQIRERHSGLLRCQHQRHGARAAPRPRRGRGVFIESATYGRGRHACDAAPALNHICDGASSCSFQVGNTLCGDPRKGKRKHIEIVYSCGRARYRADFKEREQGILGCH